MWENGINWFVPYLLGTFAKLRKATISFVISVRPRGATRLPPDGLHEI